MPIPSGKFADLKCLMFGRMYASFLNFKLLLNGRRIPYRLKEQEDTTTQSPPWTQTSFASVDTTMATRRMVGRSERGQSKGTGDEKSQWRWWSTTWPSQSGNTTFKAMVRLTSSLTSSPHSETPVISSSPPDIPTLAVDQRSRR